MQNDGSGWMRRRYESRNKRAQMNCIMTDINYIANVVMDRRQLFLPKHHY